MAEHAEADGQVNNGPMTPQDDRLAAGDVTEVAGGSAVQFLLTTAHTPHHALRERDKVVRAWFAKAIKPVFDPAAALEWHASSLLLLPGPSTLKPGTTNNGFRDCDAQSCGEHEIASTVDILADYGKRQYVAVRKPLKSDLIPPQ